MGKKRFMRKDEFATWLAESIKRRIEESCEYTQKRFLISLRDDPNDKVVQIYSEIYDWKTRAEDENGLIIEEISGDEDLQLVQKVVEDITKYFSAEIEKIES